MGSEHKSGYCDEIECGQDRGKGIECDQDSRQDIEL